MLSSPEVRAHWDAHVAAMVAARTSGTVGGRGRKLDPIDIEKKPEDEDDESDEEDPLPKKQKQVAKKLKSEFQPTQLPK